MIETIKTGIEDVLETLRECEGYFDNYADADHDYTGFVPNREMVLLVAVREAIDKMEKHK